MTWIVLAFSSALFAALATIFGKVGVKSIDSTVATALRTIVVLLCAWGMVLLVGSQGGIYTISRRSLIFLLLSGVATGASWLCYYRALQRGNVNQVAPIDKSSAILTMILAIVIFREPFTWLTIVAIVLILLGTLLMITRESGGVRRGGSGWLLYAVLSAVFAALTTILAKVGISGVESNLGTAIRTGVVLVMAWLMVCLTGKVRQVGKVTLRSAVFLVLSGAATGASWLCYYRALQQGLASVVVPIDKLSIVIVVLFARIFLGEKLSGKALGGLTLIVMGTVCMLI